MRLPLQHPLSSQLQPLRLCRYVYYFFVETNFIITAHETSFTLKKNIFLSSLESTNIHEGHASPSPNPEDLSYGKHETIPFFSRSFDFKRKYANPCFCGLYFLVRDNLYLLNFVVVGEPSLVLS